jgi:DNA-binding LytR/AlgR family response regulator
MTYNCIIIDDEADAHIVLKHHCEKDKRIVILGQCYNAKEALLFLKTNIVDFIFLDVNMPEISGFGMLSILEQQPKIIFTTAYSEYALQSFEHNVIDYLLKPISAERFTNAINKLAITYTSNQSKNLLTSPLIFDGIEKEILPSEILYAESCGNYVKFYLQNSNVLTHSTMQKIADRLTNYGFVRIHKKYIVQLALITSVTLESITLVENIMLPIGISYRQVVVGLSK